MSKRRLIICIGCGKEKPIRAKQRCDACYEKTRRKINPEVYSRRSRNDYLKHKEKRCRKQGELQVQYIKSWLDFLKNEYKTPHCQICGKELKWRGGRRTDVVHWDHRNGYRHYPKYPSQFFVSRPCNKANIKKWKSFKFGILCGKCNQFLPTEDRIKFLEKALIYSQMPL